MVLEGAAMLAVALGSFASASTAADGVAGERCFDAAVIVRLVRQEEWGLIDDPSDLIGHSVFSLTLRAERTLYSRVDVPRGTFTVSIAAHGAMRSDIKNLLVFLSRNGNGFVVRWHEVYITRDEHGRWVRPLQKEFLEEAPEEMLFPDFWIPRDLGAHLVSLRYRTRDAWWQRDEYDGDGNPIPLSARPKYIEEKGFVLADMRDSIASLADQKCQ